MGSIEGVVGEPMITEYIICLNRLGSICHIPSLNAVERT